MNNITETIKRRYNRTAFFYDWMDFMISDSTRRKVLGMAKGKVLEVGVGTGKNLPLYPPECEVTGIDFSSEMLKRAMERVKKNNLKITLLEMDAQHMDFPDNTFDTVVATCVFCSVPDPIKGLKEVKRVCKPTGQIILLEHVRSENPVLGKIMDILNPITLAVIGSNINRETVQNVSRAGLAIQEVKNLGSTKILKLIIASPNDLEEITHK
ncbi:ubiquinone/menaquinone biosynthesis C-methylase UbiE [Desulfohalotomaculum tongense]|uniref:class I SAM-dependent methyltransferase n=1 Tax=Desulforadius tongensis TaxID=1216062 RepID=UPI0019588D44|nr:class I SAM-dependent methyltransferase [Desulforadius tongensis]MBM7855885.1 ubiquinone/menaquinone biosynthesis C-methylase UbiE [Desulforadius tongensis]